VAEYYGTIGPLVFVVFLVFLFIREIRGYAAPPIPTRAYDAWLTCARTLKGRFSPAVGIHHPRIDFLLSGRTAYLQFVVKNGRALKGQTALRVNVAGLSPGRLTLKSKGRKTIPPRAGPTDPDFDRWFVGTRAEPETILSHLLSPPIKEKLVQPFLALRRFGEATIELGSQSLSLEIGSLLTEESQQLELASVMGTMMECFFGSAAAFPIELVDVSNPECARCSICRSELREHIVRCVACQTPHHEDCWRFNARCSTYGCGETRCIPEPSTDG
jgi:hypothetical protein